MKKRSSLVVVLMCCLILVSCVTAKFNGCSVGTNDGFKLDFTIMNTTDSRNITYKEGDKIQVTIDLSKGEADISIADGDNVVYEDKSVENGTFEVTIPKDGTYTLQATCRHAAGTITFEKVKENGKR